MSIWNTYETDLSAEADGVWIDFGDDVQMRLRSMRSQKARKVLDEQARRQLAEIRRTGGFLSAEQRDANDIEMLAKALIADWRGVTGRDGSPLACSETTIREVMGALPMLRERVFEVVRSDETFRKASLDAMRGNSSPASNGN